MFSRSHYHSMKMLRLFRSFGSVQWLTEGENEIDVARKEFILFLLWFQGSQHHVATKNIWVKCSARQWLCVSPITYNIRSVRFVLRQSHIRTFLMIKQKMLLLYPFLFDKHSRTKPLPKEWTGDFFFRCCFVRK